MEQEALAYIDRIEEMGGMLRAIEVGYPQKEIADAAFAFQMASDAGEYVTVGVNGYRSEDDRKLEVLKIDLKLEEQVRREVAERKRARDAAKVKRGLDGVRNAAVDGSNMMPPIIEAVRASCSVGEIADVFRERFGVYGDPAWL
jgi:methylmalonyl-CoA mutase N-terminal domain/subunit